MLPWDGPLSSRSPQPRFSQRHQEAADRLTLQAARFFLASTRVGSRPPRSATSDPVIIPIGRPSLVCRELFHPQQNSPRSPPLSPRLDICAGASTHVPAVIRKHLASDFESLRLLPLGTKKDYLKLCLDTLRINPAATFARRTRRYGCLGDGARALFMLLGIES